MMRKLRGSGQEFALKSDKGTWKDWEQERDTICISDKSL